MENRGQCVDCHQEFEYADSSWAIIYVQLRCPPCQAQYRINLKDEDQDRIEIARKYRTK